MGEYVPQSNDSYELEQICNHILRQLGEVKPALSASITKQLRQSRYEKATPLQRKFEKIRILKAQDAPFLDAILQDLNHAEYKGRRGPLNCFDLMERLLTHLHPFGELTGGNYRGL